MIISDKETISDIQKLAKIGYWTYDIINNKFNYSKELMDLCINEEYVEGFELEDFINIVAEDDVDNVRRIIYENKGMKSLYYEFEFRIKSGTSKDRYVKAVVSKKLDESNTKVLLVQGILEDITELKESQLGLKKNKDRLDFAVNIAGMGIWEWDVQSDVSQISPYIYEMANLPSGTVLNHDIWRSKIHEENKERVQNEISSCVKGETLSYNSNYRYIKPNGEYIWVNSIGAALERDSEGVASRMLGIMFDITERKLAEEKLLISESRLIDAQHLTKLGNWEVDLVTKQVYWSEEVFRIHGFKPNEVTPSTDLFLQHIHAEDIAYVTNEVKKLETIGKYFLVSRINTNDGKLKYIEEIAYSVKDSEGNIIKHVGTTQDITESKLAEETIRQSEMALLETQKTAKIGSWKYYPGTKTLDASTEFYRLYGYKNNTVDLEPNFIYSHVFEADRARLEAYEASLVDGKQHTVTYRILSKNGLVKHIKDTGKAFFDEKNKMISYQGYIQDITEIKKKEHVIIDSRERLQIAADLANLGYWEYYVDTQKLLIHELYTDSLNADLFKEGGSINEFLKKLENEDKQKVITSIRTMIKNGEDSEIDIKIKVGSEIVWLLVKGSCYYANNNLIKLYGYVQDVTERHNSHEALTQAKEKAEESDRLKSAFLANMSHEIRTPLNSVMGFSEMIVEEGCTSEEKDDYADAIYRNSKSLFQLINDILDISLLETNEIEITNSEVELNSIISNLYNEIDHSNEALKINSSILEENIYVSTDGRRLSQILKNFLNNAIKYTEKGSIDIGAKRQDNGNISLYVKDTGMGISEEFLYKIFDRFHQSNKFKDGVGIGLSISKGFADILKFELKVESHLNVGSIFSVEIPVERLISL